MANIEGQHEVQWYIRDMVMPNIICNAFSHGWHRWRPSVSAWLRVVNDG